MADTIKQQDRNIDIDNSDYDTEDAAPANANDGFMEVPDNPEKLPFD